MLGGNTPQYLGAGQPEPEDRRIAVRRRDASVPDGPDDDGDHDAEHDHEQRHGVAADNGCGNATGNGCGRGPPPVVASQRRRHSVEGTQVEGTKK